MPAEAMNEKDELRRRLAWGVEEQQRLANERSDIDGRTHEGFRTLRGCDTSRRKLSR